MESFHASAPAAHAVARHLIDCGCVAVRTDEPFRLPSGWASPVYMDARRLISFPRERRDVVAHGIGLLERQGCLEGLASVAAGEASGIALGAWIAQALDVPLQYVRKRPVGQSQIEGEIRPGDKVLLVDDMMAAGHSKARFGKALTAVGAKVEDVFVVFDYGTFPTAELLSPLGLTVHALATWHDVLAVACERGDFSDRALKELQDFLHEPPAWSQAHGGLGAAAPVFSTT
ncbi:orotate phosphoribosyltransferase [Variovorax sp. RA8]|uniref:orotate phosphoribosyltransferase n=1 Tax=Variovorax sp. (strain JCM 16519 / RA8) TaxID=662548 RepID=UPI0013187660|nr:phosphoribosyltransferase family protein [Variovorax sp. RA8]VTU42677.1 Orotate phosphoribosyltransferase [Variovorax sp. RA8]